MKNLTWQNPEQLFVAQELINKVKSKCCGIKDRYKRLQSSLERVLCPRVHFKIVVIDCSICYIGSANLTGAGMGMKSPNRRNFEAGILTDEPSLVDEAMEEFDKVWRGEMCKKCQRKQYCSDPIVTK